MRQALRTITSATLLLLCVGDVAQADFNTSRSSSRFDGHIVFCAPPSDPVNVEVLPDGTQILEFVNIGNIWLTGNWLVDGVEENHVTATTSPDSPITRIDINAKTNVEAVEGGWRIWQHILVSPEGDTGWGFGIGKGDLRGRLLVFRSSTPEEITNSPCGVPFGVPIWGKVVTFRWRT